MNTQISDLVAFKAAQRYSANPSALKFLGGFCNSVYEYELKGQSYVMRISYNSLRTIEMIYAEIDLLRYLAEKGLSVAQPVPSLAGNWLEVAAIEGKEIPVVAFEKAPGQPPQSHEWNETLFRKMGRFMGTMHHLIREFAQDDAAYRRPTWQQDMDAFATAYLSAEDRAIQERYGAIRSYLEHLPQGKDNYGLAHLDFHRGNFFLYEGKLTLFDFDDCQYSWFADDLAMALFYAVWPQVKSAQEYDFAQRFYDAFLEEYSRENTLEERWLLEIPYFLQRREISLYMILTSLGENQWDERMKQFMQGRRERILGNVPYADLRFA